MAEKEPEKKEEAKQQQPQQQQGKQKKEQQPQKEQRKESRERGPQKATSIIRIGGKDINGDLNIERALSNIKGIGHNLSHVISHTVETKLSIPRSTTLGSLSEAQIESIEDVIKEPTKYGIPLYMLNRRKDMETGKDVHVIGNDLLFATRQDVNRDVTLRAWRGYRHQHGQKVRGQRTRSTGRTGATIGVMKKAAKQQMAAAAQEKGNVAKKEEKK